MINQALSSIIFVYVVLFPRVVYSALITYEFAGETTFVSQGNLFDGVNIGDKIEGSFTFDDRLANSARAVTLINSFRGDIPDANMPLNLFFEAQLSVGDITVTANPTTNANDKGEVLIQDSRTEDRVGLSMFLFNGAVPSLFFSLNAFDTRVFDDPDGVVMGSNNLTGSMQDALDILDGLDLSKFNLLEGQSFWHDIGGGRLDFTWTDLERVPDQPTIPPIPIPASIWLFGTALVGLVRLGIKSR